jgi:hypothetical protein
MGSSPRSLQQAHAIDDGERCPHCPLRIVLVGARPAEIGQHAVAHQLGNVTLETDHRVGNGVLVRAEHVPHLLRVEPA